MRIDERTLNRVTLERQLLLQRSPMPVVNAIGRLVGMQAQAVNAPYLDCGRGCRTSHWPTSPTG